MGTITVKELTDVDEMLTREEVLVKKYATFSGMFTDPQLKQKFEQVSARHQDHINRLLSYLKI